MCVCVCVGDDSGSVVVNNSSFHSCQRIRVSCAGDSQSPAAVGENEDGGTCVCVCVGVLIILVSQEH